MKIFIILLMCLSLCGCSSENKINQNPNTELKEILLEDNYIIIDVRTKEEFDESHLKDALNIPIDEINEEIELNKSKTILVYCKSGNRSGMAAEALTDLGYEVYDLGALDNISLPKE